jgi:NAD(P)-dependent dehydrogenase (short-subunit alcohol dehydrogenase family)
MNLEKHFSLAGQVALVVGASRGIGQAIAEGLADAGAHVVLAARSVPQLESIAQGIRDAGGSASAIALDVTKRASASAAVEKVLKDRGRIDILVNVFGLNFR